jgi:hypothetical protein
MCDMLLFVIPNPRFVQTTVLFIVSALLNARAFLNSNQIVAFIASRDLGYA